MAFEDESAVISAIVVVFISISIKAFLKKIC